MHRFYDSVYEVFGQVMRKFAETQHTTMKHHNITTAGSLKFKGARIPKKRLILQKVCLREYRITSW